MKVVLVLAIIFFAGCSHSIIAKECKEVDGGNISVCKTMKPWE